MSGESINFGHDNQKRDYVCSALLPNINYVLPKLGIPQKIFQFCSRWFLLNQVEQNGHGSGQFRLPTGIKNILIASITDCRTLKTCVAIEQIGFINWTRFFEIIKMNLKQYNLIFFVGTSTPKYQTALFNFSPIYTECEILFVTFLL